MGIAGISLCLLAYLRYESEFQICDGSASAPAKHLTLGRSSRFAGNGSQPCSPPRNPQPGSLGLAPEIITGWASVPQTLCLRFQMNQLPLESAPPLCL